ncbi:ATP-binding protein [Oceanotoga sp. DSM 15011]|uniref:ATP-binding protein n=1 Tax=Oceanotoga sp. DSM 15011 TaxID=2984951 RepID=UPI0021F43DDA|nr:ATP-binding protein [Oceanotoga sp. DSM 15011]UYP01238.1 ATP-binding protein [Oceanotoga sp. DSM 15011]
MKQISIVSGKGGTGKTTLSGALNFLFQNNTAADCDVDASNLYLLLNPKLKKQYDYYGGKKAFIEQDKCIKCGKCQTLCRFDAIDFINEEFKINEYSCEGCNLCVLKCPVKAIELIDNRAGEYYLSENEKMKVIHGSLEPGEETSGGLVAEIRKKAIEVSKEEKTDYIIIDGAPGMGCPATSSITGVNYVIIVTEPTKSGIHDLKRIIDTTKHFKRDFGIVINRFDLNIQNTELIEKFCKDNGIKLLGNISFDETVLKATQKQKSIIEYDSKAKEDIINIFNNLMEEIS